jgi:hypothetical protein
MSDLFAGGLMAHLIADWFLQNEWMALNKTNPKHPAGYVHAGIHTLAMLLLFPWPIALAIGVTHWFIDLRFALATWRRFFRQTTEGSMAVHVAIWQDQVAHFVVILAAAVFVS